MTREELIDLEVAFTDEWYKKHTGVPTYADAIEWEHKRMIAKACEWLNMNIMDYITEGSREGISLENQKQLIEDFRKAMEE